MAKWTTVGGVFAAIGVCASCCLLPLALAALGVGGAWVGGLKSFVPYKPIFVIIAAGLLAYGFYVVYWRRNKACMTGAACASCRPGRSARIGLWVATILAASSVLFDYLEPYLFGS
jgi:mercuric ion transport protein